MEPHAQDGGSPKNEKQEGATLELLRQLKEDPAAFGLFTERYSQRLKRIVRQLMKGKRRHLPGNSDDFCQDTLLAALSSLPLNVPKDDRHLSRYLRKIARHRILDALKKNRPALIDDVALEGWEPSAPGDSPDERLQWADLMAAVHATLLLLPAERRGVLARWLEDGNDAVDLAELGATGAERMRLHRVRKELQRRLGPRLREMIPHWESADLQSASDAAMESRFSRGKDEDT